MAMDPPDRSTAIHASGNRLKIAAFAFNLQRGGTATMGEGSLAELKWEQQVRIAQLAESAGCEAIIPAARWRGYNGPSNWSRDSYDNITWAAGISAVTSRATIFSTMHVPLFHPVAVAKMTSTVDHISGGRFALNVVSGWNADEFEMFDYKQREHDDRYKVSTEWVTLLKRLWTANEEFDFEGEFYKSPHTYSMPQPIQNPRPSIMSAGSSPAGRQFAAENADICFAGGTNLHEMSTAAADIRDRAAKAGRDIQVWTSMSMVCGETEEDAKRQYNYFVHEKGDWEAAEDSIRKLMGGGMKSQNWKISDAQKEGRIAGSMGGPIMGSPEMVVERMNEVSNAGIDGIATVWFDYERGLEAFRDLVQPLAVKAGLRVD